MTPYSSTSTSSKLLLATLRFCKQKLKLSLASKKSSSKTLNGTWEEMEGITPEVTYVTGRVSKTGNPLPDGIEVRFPKGAVASTEVREKLKNIGFKFSQSNDDARWYVYDTPELRAFVNEFAAQSTTAYKIPEGEKHAFWAKVRSEKDWRFVPAKAPIQVAGKLYQTKADANTDLGAKLNTAIEEGKVKFKKFFTVKGDGSEEGEEGEEGENGGPKASKAQNKVQSTSKNTSASSAETNAEKLRDIANGMQKAIDYKLNPPIAQLNRTRRRLAIAASMYEDGKRMMAVQFMLYALASAWEDGTVKWANQFTATRLIGTLLSKAKVETILFYFNQISGKQNSSAFFTKFERLYPNMPEWIREHITSYEDWEKLDTGLAAILKKWEEDGKQGSKYATPKGSSKANNSEEIEKLERQIKEAENNLFNAKIAGFYPTPPELIQRMIDAADLSSGQTVMEPSAGKGDIYEALVRHDPNLIITVNEPVKPLMDIIDLRSKYLSLSLGLKRPHAFDTFSRNDFLKMEPDGEWNIYYDRILMNPPFENGQDIDHVRHAFEFLKPKGKLVAIMGEGAFYRNYKKDTEFRNWISELQEQGLATVSEKITDAFKGKQSFNQTGVVVRMVIISKPLIAANNSKPTTSTLPSSTQTSDDTDDLDLAEIEADAELELMRLRKDLGVNGTEEPEEIGVFGSIYRQFYHNGEEAIKFLMEQKNGECTAAFYNPEIGNIDLVWGKWEVGSKGNFGLAKVIAKHNHEFEKLGYKLETKIPEIISNGKLIKAGSNPEKYYLENNEIRIVISTELIKTKKQAMITCFVFSDILIKKR